METGSPAKYWLRSFVIAEHCASLSESFPYYSTQTLNRIANDHLNVKYLANLIEQLFRYAPHVYTYRSICSNQWLGAFGRKNLPYDLCAIPGDLNVNNCTSFRIGCQVDLTELGLQLNEYEWDSIQRMAVSLNRFSAWCHTIYLV